MVVAMPRTGQQGILWWLSTSNFNSFLSPLCFFHRNSENVPCPHGRAFPPSPLALKPKITWTPWSVPRIMPQSLPGAPFSASHPLGPRSAITPSGKTFHPDWLGRPSPELPSQCHNTDNDLFRGWLSQDWRPLACRHGQVWCSSSPVPNPAAGAWSSVQFVEWKMHYEMSECLSVVKKASLETNPDDHDVGIILEHLPLVFIQFIKRLHHVRSFRLGMFNVVWQRNGPVDLIPLPWIG